MKEISKNWSPEVLIKHFSPDIVKDVGKGKIEQIVVLCKTLGEHKNNSMFSITEYPMRPNSIIVSMQCDFEKGKGFVRLVLTKLNENWMIEGININSEVFFASVMKKSHNLLMSLDDSFVIKPRKSWNIDIEKELSLRFADVYITPKKGFTFSMKLYFKCDTKDLALYDLSSKIKRSVYMS